MNSKSPLGFLYALLAYASWGVFPLYWKLLAGTSPLEIIGHRVLWSLFFLLVLVAFFQQMGELRQVLTNKAQLGILLLTATLLSTNWGLFIYGVISNHVVQTSFGYFLNPLVTILFGFLFLKERLTRLQWVAVAIAACGVLLFGITLGRFPWIAVGLAVTFAFYGLLRKIVAVSPLVGLLAETMLMGLPAIFVVWSYAETTQFGSSLTMNLLFIGAGVVTTLPLIWFNSAAKLLPLSTMGFLQYVAPTLQLLIGIFVFRESFSTQEAMSFGLIWAAIGLYLYTLWRSRRYPVLVPDAD